MHFGVSFLRLKRSPWSVALVRDKELALFSCRIVIDSNATKLSIIMAKPKSIGQIYTPNYLVKVILDFAGYSDHKILQKHVIDNSCGDGAFITEIVERYCHSFLLSSNNLSTLSKELSTYIHGIELDTEEYLICIENLNCITQKYGLSHIKWDIHNADALTIEYYDKKMDFVVGNPPYVRVHNLNNYDAVKKFHFAAKGMTDLFIVFFEVGFRMLSPNGTMCIITPSSWLSSKAGESLRKHIAYTQILNGVIDLEHFQPFKATTYTLISRFQNGVKSDYINYYRYNDIEFLSHIEKLFYQEINIKNNFYLATHKTLQVLQTIQNTHVTKRVSVKNGFATLSDKIFIGSHIFEECSIDIIKASTGRWTKCIFPYDGQPKPLSTETIQKKYPQTYSYLLSRKDLLQKRDSDKSNWHLFGRTQALNDVYKNKIAINTIIKDLSSIKLNYVPSGKGVYSGLYILTNIDFNIIKNIIFTNEFIDFVKTLKNYKSGGYYTFSSKNLELFLNYKLKDYNDEQPTISENYLPFI